MTAAPPEICPPALHTLEAEVMEVVWALREANCRATLEALNARHARKRAYTTVMTTMSRLDGKGMLRRRREGRTDVYAPVMSREEYLAARASASVGALVEAYGELALVNFARQMERLDPERRERLRRLAGGD